MQAAGLRASNTSGFVANRVENIGRVGLQPPRACPGRSELSPCVRQQTDGVVDAELGYGELPNAGRRRRSQATDLSNSEGRIVHRSLKWFSYVVLALMGSGVAYASYIGMAYWTGIGV